MRGLFREERPDMPRMDGWYRLEHVQKTSKLQLLCHAVCRTVRGSQICNRTHKRRSGLRRLSLRLDQQLPWLVTREQA